MVSVSGTKKIKVVMDSVDNKLFKELFLSMDELSFSKILNNLDEDTIAKIKNMEPELGKRIGNLMDQPQNIKVALGNLQDSLAKGDPDYIFEHIYEVAYYGGNFRITMKDQNTLL